MRRIIPSLVGCLLLHFGQPKAALAADGRFGTPQEAVERVAAEVIGDALPISLPKGAFEGLPPPGPQISFRAIALAVDEAHFRLSVRVEAHGARAVLARRDYTFPWTISEPIVVPKRVIRAGSLIVDEDLEVRTVDLDGSHDELVVSLDGLVGRVARRTLLPGRPVAARSLELPAVIRRGSPVTVSVYLGRMEVSMEGEAMSDGAVGDDIRVLNPTSKRVLFGRVTGHGHVEVGR